MKHKSVKLNTPCEMINITSINPLISKCQIKVCYVGEQPNRNKTVITREVAEQLANTLPGSPIVGYFNDSTGDFEEHNKIIEISGGQFELKENTRPYGFVDLNAKCWFQKFIDDGVNEREYLMTEGYLWTGQYPDCKRVIDQGNNQSMELDAENLDGTWSKDNNGKPEFFIINEAVISKLCILGEEVEPCFEGATIEKFEFSLNDDFKNQLFSMMNEIKELLKKGGSEVFNQYAVEIGCALWDCMYEFLRTNYRDPDDEWCSIYSTEGIYEEGTQKFAILRERSTGCYFRMNFEYTEENGFVPETDFIKVEKTYVPIDDANPQFALQDVEDYVCKKKAAKCNAKEEKEDMEEDDDDEEECPECKKPKKECACGKKKKDFELECEELQAKIESLTAELNSLKEQCDSLTTEIEPLRTFKLEAETKDKQAMIDRFYMLSDEDKQDVIANMATYSLDDIEAKLSVICVRNKVRFDLDDDKENNPSAPMTYNLTGEEDDDAGMPAWVKAALETANEI